MRVHADEWKEPGGRTGELPWCASMNVPVLIWGRLQWKDPEIMCSTIRPMPDTRLSFVHSISSTGWSS